MRDTRLQAAIVRDGCLLLVEMNLSGEPPFWALPGGGRETGESDAEAVAREAKEELGMAVEVGDLLLDVPADPPDGTYTRWRKRVRPREDSATRAEFESAASLKVQPTADGGAYAVELAGRIWRLEADSAVLVIESSTIPADTTTARRGTDSVGWLLYTRERRQRERAVEYQVRKKEIAHTEPTESAEGSSLLTLLALCETCSFPGFGRRWRSRSRGTR